MGNKKKGKPRFLTRYLVRWAGNLYLANDNPTGPQWVDTPSQAFHFPTRKRAEEVRKKILQPSRAETIPLMIRNDGKSTRLKCQRTVKVNKPGEK